VRIPRCGSLDTYGLSCRQCWRMSLQTCSRSRFGKFLRRSPDKASALSGQQAPATYSIRQQLCSFSGHLRTPGVCRLRSCPFVWSGPNRNLGRFKLVPCPQSIAGPEPSPEPAKKLDCNGGQGEIFSLQKQLALPQPRNDGVESMAM